MTEFKLVSPLPGARFVVLDPIDDRATPPTEYCVHGRVPCVACGCWCWLGSETHKRVVEGHAIPVCMPCANAMPYRTGAIGHVQDHRRADGPHEG